MAAISVGLRISIVPSIAFVHALNDSHVPKSKYGFTTSTTHEMIARPKLSTPVGQIFVTGMMGVHPASSPLVASTCAAKLGATSDICADSERVRVFDAGAPSPTVRVNGMVSVALENV